MGGVGGPETAVQMLTWTTAKVSFISRPPSSSDARRLLMICGKLFFKSRKKAKRQETREMRREKQQENTCKGGSALEELPSAA